MRRYVKIFLRQYLTERCRNHKLRRKFFQCFHALFASYAFKLPHMKSELKRLFLYRRKLERVSASFRSVGLRKYLYFVAVSYERFKRRNGKFRSAEKSYPHSSSSSLKSAGGSVTKSVYSLPSRWSSSWNTARVKSPSQVYSISCPFLLNARTMALLGLTTYPF